MQVVIVKAFVQCARFRVWLCVTASMEELHVCASSSSSSSGRVKSGANQRDWSSSRSRNGECTPVCSRWPSQLWSSNGDISRELRAAWQRQRVNGYADIANCTRRAPKQAQRLRFLWRTLSRKTAVRWRNDWNAKHKNWPQNAMPPRQAPRHAWHCDSRPRRPRWRNAQVPH